MRVAALGLSAMLVLAAASPSFAEMTPNKDGWTCGAPGDWEIAVFRPAPKLILNNFFFDEKDSFRTEMRVLAVEYSATNRHAEGYSMTGQFVGFDQAGTPTFAMSVSPMMDIANPGTETAEDDVYITSPVLSRTTRICGAFAVQSRE